MARGIPSTLQIQRALRLLHRPDRDAVGVDLGGCRVGKKEKRLNDADVVACLKEVGGEGVAENVGGHFLGSSCLPDSDVKRLSKVGLMHMPAPPLTGFR